MEKGVKIASIVSGSVIIVALIISYVIFQIIPTSTLSVNGQSQINVVPDLITVNFYIETSANSASEAKDKNTESYNLLVDALTEIGIAEEEIKTSSFSVNPEYDWINGKRVDKGYVARHYITVEQSSDNSENIGKIIDAGVNAGALISYINFELSEELQNQKKSEATLKATEDAKIKAESMVEGLGKRLGRIVLVSDGSWGYNPWPVYSLGREDMAVAEAGALAKESITSTSITPSEQTVYGNVAVVYKIR